MVWTTRLLFQMLIKKILHGVYEVVMEGTHPATGSLITFKKSFHLSIKGILKYCKLTDAWHWTINSNLSTMIMKRVMGTQ